MDDEYAPVTPTEPLRAQLLSECQIMAHFALSTGKDLPRPVLNALGVLERNPKSTTTFPMLAELYGQLVRVVEPATPSGLRLVQEDKEKHPRLHILGPVPSIRSLMVAAILFSLIFFGVSLFPEINRQTLSHDIYDMSGPQLLVALLFLLSAAGLGAAFGALFDAYQYVSEGSYDTKFDSLYWARIGLGLVSGLMLAELLPQDTGRGQLLERPLLALLGGFSASVVHKIVQRLAGAVESVFLPEAKADLALTQRAIRQRAAEEQNLQRAAMARSFHRLLEQVAAGGSVGDARRGLLDLVSGHMGGLFDAAGKAADNSPGGDGAGDLEGGHASGETEPPRARDEGRRDPGSIARRGGAPTAKALRPGGRSGVDTFAPVADSHQQVPADTHEAPV